MNNTTINMIISTLLIISAIIVGGQMIYDYYKYNTNEQVNVRALNPPMAVGEIREVSYNINYVRGIIDICGIEVIHTRNPGTYRITVNTNNREDCVRMIYSTEWKYSKNDRFGAYNVSVSESNKFEDSCITTADNICANNIKLPDELTPSMKIKLLGHGSGNISIQRIE